MTSLSKQLMIHGGHPPSHAYDHRLMPFHSPESDKLIITSNEFWCCITIVTFEFCAYNIFTLQGLDEDNVPEDVLMVNDDVARGVLCCNFFICQGEKNMLPDKH